MATGNGREGIGKVPLFTFAVVAFSMFAQGLTITPLLRRLGQFK